MGIFFLKIMLLIALTTEKAETVPALLDWTTASTRMAWGPVFILGGGFALATVSDVCCIPHFLIKTNCVF